MHLFHTNHFAFTETTGTIVGTGMGILTSLAKKTILFTFIMPSWNMFLEQAFIELALALPAGIIGACGGFIGTMFIKWLWAKLFMPEGFVMVIVAKKLWVKAKKKLKIK